MALAIITLAAIGCTNDSEPRVTPSPSPSSVDSDHQPCGDEQGLDHRGARLKGTTFSDRDLYCSKFKDAHLEDVKFSDDQLVLADFRGAELVAVTFRTTDLNLASFEGASLKNVRFEGANLRDANLHGVRMDSVSFSNTICPDGVNSDDYDHTCEGHGFFATG